MDSLKIYLPLYLTAYLLIAFVLPTYRTYKSTGIKLITFGNTDNAHDYIGFVMKVLISGLFIAVLFYSLYENLYEYLVPIHYLESSGIRLLGMTLIHISLLWIGIAQYQMSNSWRIGIDHANKTKLVTKGIFSISRNPIFLGMILSVFGIFFIIPNALLFCLSVASYLVIQIQIRLEEEFLEQQHGQEYRDYKANTRRLI